MTKLRTLIRDAGFIAAIAAPTAFAFWLVLLFGPRWPEISTNKELAASLIGAWVTLLAAAVAWRAVQHQIKSAQQIMKPQIAIMAVQASIQISEHLDELLNGLKILQKDLAPARLILDRNGIKANDELDLQSFNARSLWEYFISARKIFAAPLGEYAISIHIQQLFEEARSSCANLEAVVDAMRPRPDQYLEPDRSQVEASVREASNTFPDAMARYRTAILHIDTAIETDRKTLVDQIQAIDAQIRNANFHSDGT